MGHLLQKLSHKIDNKNRLRQYRRKQAMLGAGTVIGSLLGGATAGKGNRLEGLGRGAARGAGVDIGSTIGGGLGAAGGGIAGGLAGAVLGPIVSILAAKLSGQPINPETLANFSGAGAAAGMQLGALGGGIGGGVLGGVTGYRAAGKILPPQSTDKEEQAKVAMLAGAEHLLLSREAAIMSSLTKIATKLMSK